jgi:hypothetical protein
MSKRKAEIKHLRAVMSGEYMRLNQVAPGNSIVQATQRAIYEALNPEGYARRFPYDDKDGRHVAPGPGPS